MCVSLRKKVNVLSPFRVEGDFHRRNIVERTNKAEIRPEEQSEKAESWENLWKEIQPKRP